MRYRDDFNSKLRFSIIRDITEENRDLEAKNLEPFVIDSPFKSRIVSCLFMEKD
jgi:hypothetical protein